MIHRMMTWAAATMLAAALAGCARGGNAATAPATQTVPAAGSTTSSGRTAPATSERTIAISLTRGAVTGEVSPTVAVGQTVVITVRSDAADELHVHGYDRSVELAPGRVARLRFTADIPGRFNAELHHAGIRALVLTVR